MHFFIVLTFVCSFARAHSCGRSSNVFKQNYTLQCPPHAPVDGHRFPKGKGARVEATHPQPRSAHKENLGFTRFSWHVGAGLLKLLKSWNCEPEASLAEAGQAIAGTIITKARSCTPQPHQKYYGTCIYVGTACKKSHIHLRGSGKRY